MNNQPKEKVVGIIPARYESSRFPGKPLAKILNKTLIQHTYENTLNCSLLNSLVVATDDARILNHVLSFGGEAVMTSSNCLTGTDRLAEVIQQHPQYSTNQSDIIINIQGDEPLLNPETLNKLVALLKKDELAVMATAVVPITEDKANDPNVVKCVMDQQNNALYFSRSLMPSNCHTLLDSKKDTPYYHHLGIYAYRRDFLLKYNSLSPTPLQLTENLEQLKVLEHGHRIKVAIVEGTSIGVDSPKDLKKVENILCKQNFSLSQAELSHP